MSYDWMWIQTSLPKEIVECIARDAAHFEVNCETSTIFGEKQDTENVIREEIRSSRHAWIPESHWIAGFVMHYANIVNNDNYQYDLIGLDGHQLQYGIYSEGGHYAWHKDYGIANCQKYNANHRHGLHPDRINSVASSSSELVRKLSFSLQLTDPSEYEGGELQIVSHNNEVQTMEKGFGTIIFFDSRIIHRVSPVTKGERRSIVGWVVGPRWK